MTAFREEADDLIREMKKDAEGFIARAKEALAAAVKAGQK